MMKQNKTLGIQQRIPLYVLGEALKEYLADGAVDEQHIKEMLQADYAGENRIKKTYDQISRVIERSHLTLFINEHSDEIALALASPTDRPLILTALICGRYPFCYHVAKVFAKQFRQQDTISAQLLDRLIAETYAFNKSTQNSRNCAVPQMIEAGLIKRDKPAQFESTEPVVPSHQVTIDLWKEAFFANEPLYSRDNDDDLCFEPFFRYVVM